MYIGHLEPVLMVEYLIGTNSAQITDFALANVLITCLKASIVPSICIYDIYEVTRLSDYWMGVIWQGKGRVEFQTFPLPRTFEQDRTRFTPAPLHDKIVIY